MDALGPLRILEYNQDQIPNVSFYGFVPHEMEQYAELCLRQTIFDNIRNNKRSLRRLATHVAHRRARLSLPLPHSWIKVLQEHGCRVNNRLSCVLFIKDVLDIYLRGIYISIKIVFQAFSLSGPRGKFAPYGMLLNVGPDNLPKTESVTELRDYSSWYYLWKMRKSNVQEVWLHCLGAVQEKKFNKFHIIGTRIPFPPLETRIKAWIFFYRVFTLVLQSGIGLIRGRWWLPLLLNEAVMLAYGNLLGRSDWAQEYLFNNSGFLKRPLWSYQAELYGSRILMVYYSVNSLFFQAGTPPQATLGGGEGIASWPNYVLMSEDQGRAILTQRRKPVPLFIEPLIGFVDNPIPLPDLPWERTVAIFNSIPFDILYLAKQGIPPGYYSGITVIRFMETIERLLEERNLIMAFKGKRKLSSKIINNAYKRHMRRIETKPHIALVDPGISAERLIENCAATISIPFTSTAVIAKALRKPSIYWDPTATLGKVAPTVHGVETIDREADLAQWLDRITEAKPSPNFDGITNRR